MHNLVLTFAAIMAASTAIGQADPEAKFAPLLGVCTSVKNHPAVAAAGFDYIEEGAGRFLVPDLPDEEFHKNLEILRQSSVPVLACNGFLPGSLKTTGPETHHGAILAYSESAFRRARGH